MESEQAWRKCLTIGARRKSRDWQFLERFSGENEYVGERELLSISATKCIKQVRLPKIMVCVEWNCYLHPHFLPQDATIIWPFLDVIIELLEMLIFSLRPAVRTGECVKLISLPLSNLNLLSIATLMACALLARSCVPQNIFKFVWTVFGSWITWTALA